MSAYSLFKTILGFLYSYGIDIRDHGDDSAETYADKNQGAATYALRMNLTVFYTHCPGHRLSLVLMTSYEKQHINNLVINIREILHFFNLPVPTKYFSEGENFAAVTYPEPYWADR